MSSTIQVKKSSLPPHPKPTKNNIEKTPSKQNRTINGLSEAKRKSLFYKLVQQEDRAIMEAWALYPDDPKAHLQYIDTYRIFYQFKLAKKHGITTKEAAEIIKEGQLFNWPLPPQPGNKRD